MSVSEPLNCGWFAQEKKRRNCQNYSKIEKTPSRRQVRWRQLIGGRQVKSQDTSLASTISDLSARVTTAENAIDAVNTSLALAIQRIDTLESQDLESRVDALEENDPIGVADRVYLVRNATNRMMYATTSTANANGSLTNGYTSWKMYKDTSEAQTGCRKLMKGAFHRPVDRLSRCPWSKQKYTKENDVNRSACRNRHIFSTKISAATQACQPFLRKNLVIPTPKSSFSLT